MNNKHSFNTTQTKVLKDIKQAIGQLVITHDVGSADKSPDIKDELSCNHEPGFANSIGIFGERGTGKSTVLIELFKRSITKDCSDTADFNLLLKKLYFVPPIDCSTLAQTNIPSAVVFLHIKNSLKNGLKPQADSKKLDDLFKELDKLIGWCTRIDRDYRKLCLELSTTPTDYDYYQQQGINERIQLKLQLRKWLKKVRGLIEHKTFVILLDDFDLSPVVQVHAWINALLDELQQAGLIFVVTADFHRLEHLSWDGQKQFDDKTGRALLNKIFPPKHRMHMLEWRIDDILNFSLTQYSSENDTVKQEQGEDLKTLLLTLFGGREKLSLNVVSSLLPHAPRGIENLYEQLPSINYADDKYTNVLKFASILASCRNEPLFARLLTERKIRPWSTHLKLNKTPLTSEQWGNLIDKSYRRPAWSVANIERLIPFNDLLDIDKTEFHNNTLGNQAAPLLHQSAYTDPLRDAKEVDHALWVELLLNLDLYSDIRYRVALLTSWEPLAKRIDGACFHVPFPRWELRAFFTDNESSLSKATMCWLKTNDDGEIYIGWQPLFLSLRGERNPLVTKLLNQLLVDTTRLQGNLPNDSNLEILPNKLWSLFVLVDALERCPWQAFSKVLNWLVVTYIALAAAFVRTAYFYTLEKSGYFKSSSRFSEIEKGFIEMLKNRDSSFLFQYSAKHSHTDSDGSLESGVWHCISELFAKDAHWQKKLKTEESKRTLVKATECYLESTMYQDVVTLLRETREFYSD